MSSSIGPLVHVVERFDPERDRSDTDGRPPTYGVLGHPWTSLDIVVKQVIQLQRLLESTILPCNDTFSKTLPCRTRADPGCFPRTAKSRRWSLRRCRARSFRCLLPHLAANEWLMSHKVGQKQRRRGLFCFALQAAEDRWLAWPWHSIVPSSEADKHPR